MVSLGYSLVSLEPGASKQHPKEQIEYKGAKVVLVGVVLMGIRLYQFHFGKVWSFYMEEPRAICVQTEGTCKQYMTDRFFNVF